MSPYFVIPAPHKVTVCEFDLRVGGRFNTEFDGGGTVMDNSGVYLDLVAQNKAGLYRCLYRRVKAHFRPVHDRD